LLGVLVGDTDGSHLAHLGPDAQPVHHKPALVETFQQLTAGDIDQAAIDGIIAAAKL
jgi:hypothetical protein